MRLEDYRSKIEGIDRGIEKRVKKRWDSLFKPVDGLGILEEMIAQIGAIQRTEKVEIEKKAILVLCSDNGVVEEDITQSSKEITKIVAENMLQKRASIIHMAEVAKAKVITVDIGMDTQTTKEGIISKKIRQGTRNILREPAMTKEEAEEAVLIGIDLVKEAKEQGISILATGEMGIGNTTTSTAITSVLLRISPEKITGEGAGLSKERVIHKAEVIKKAIALHQNRWKEDIEGNIIEVLSCLGGFDIAGLMGVFLGGAIYHIPIIMDGVISQTAALLAVKYCKTVREYLFPSHVGKEPASRLLLKELGLEAIIQAKLKLGEGTGAVLLFPILDMAASVYHNQISFEQQEIEAYQRFQK